MSTLTAVKHLPISSKSSGYFDKNSIKDISHRVDVFFIENGLFTTRALNIINAQYKYNQSMLETIPDSV